MTKRRYPWVAALANLVVPPVGHVYVGAPLRGVAIVAALALLWAGLVHLVVRPSGSGAVASILAVGILDRLVAPVDAAMIARRARLYCLRPYNRWYVYVGVAISFAVAGQVRAGWLRRDVVEAFKMPSGSMIPTILIGDHVLVDKRAYRTERPGRGDVVVFEYPRDREQRYMKRIVGLPGDVIEFRGKELRVNGDLVEEPYVQYTHEGRAMVSLDGPVTVPDGAYFVLGDNRDASSDSRHWGTVPRDAILGRVHVVYWSWDQPGPGVRWDRIGRVLGR